MAAATASVNMAAAVPVASCALSTCRSDSAVHISSSANFGGMRLNSTTAAAPSSVSRSSRTVVVRAGETQPSIWESITGLFGAGKKKVSEVAAQGEKELNKASSEAQSASGDFEIQAESFKAESLAKAEETADKVKASAEELKEKTEEAVESAKAK